MSALSDEIKWDFFQAMTILLYGCTTWTLTKCIKKNLDGKFTRMLWAILNKSWKQQPTKQQLYDRLPSISKTMLVWRTRYAGHCRWSKDELMSGVLLWTPHMNVTMLADQRGLMYIRRERLMTGKDGGRLLEKKREREREKEPWKSVLSAWLDYIYIYIYICLCARAYFVSKILIYSYGTLIFVLFRVGLGGCFFLSNAW